MDFRLVNLDCPACGSAMTGSSHDILFLCQHCGSGAVLQTDGLDTVESTALLPAPGHRAEVWRPAWTLEAKVDIDQRRLFGGQRTEDWSGRRTFVIPAFTLALTDLTLLARALTGVAHTTREVPKEPCHGGTLDLEDAQTLVRYLIVGEEAQKPDKLSTINVAVTPLAHRITALPFERDNDFLVCAITGVKVRSL